MIECGKILIKDNPEDLAWAGAELFCKAAETAVSQKGCFTVALSGGSTPRPMHRLLTKDPFRTGIPWNQTHVFWVDERMVSYDHPHSNFGLFRNDLLDHVSLPAANIHPMPNTKTPDENAFLYQKQLDGFFNPPRYQYPVFDLIVLGLGNDGHIASLFPGTPDPENKAAWVMPVKGGNPDVFRLTLTFPVLNNAARLLFLVSGKEKAEVIHEVFEKPSADLPAQHIRPHRCRPTWLLDRLAASMLSTMKQGANKT